MTPYATTLYIRKSEHDGNRLAAIYGLFDQGRCLYVGRTRNPHSRLAGHKARFANAKMMVLELVAVSQGLAGEEKWIRFYRKLGEAEHNFNGTHGAHSIVHNERYEARRAAGTAKGRARWAGMTPEESAAFTSLGGHARAAKLSKAERKESARHAARIRWAKQAKKTVATGAGSKISSATGNKQKE